MVRKSVSRRACFVLHLHFNQPGEPTFIILNDLLSLNINVQCTMYIVHVHVTSMIKCFGNIFIFFRLEMFTRRKSTSWTGGCFSLLKTIYYLQPFSSCALKKCALINISPGGSSATGTSRGPKQTSGSTSNTYKTSYL